MITTYTCRAEFDHPRSHCQVQELDQCEYCQWYQSGAGVEHYPVPAIIYHVYLPGPDYDDPSASRCGSIWEYSRFSCEPYEETFNRRVMVLCPMEN